MSSPEQACLVIADITGYTEYLAGVELDHAQDILADLMTTVVKGLRPAFKLAKLEGDAAFVYALTSAVDGSVLLDTMEGCYYAFRRRMLSIRQGSTCACSACARIPSLNLKLVAHHGSVVIQKVAGRSELVGADVIAVHRLLKNSIIEPAYALITEACVAVSGLDLGQLGWRRHVEAYEHVGEIAGWVEDLERAWQSFQDRSRIYVGADANQLELSAFLAAPAGLVWEYISSPSKRPLWSHGMDRVDQIDASGRRRAGTLNHCMHGKDTILQEFIDWNPPRYYTSRSTIPGMFSVLSTHEVEPVDGGSMIHERFMRPKDKATWPAWDQFSAMFGEAHQSEVARLAELLAAEVATIEPEPDLPVSDEQRRLSSAVH